SLRQGVGLIRISV
ncbi:unnamed protein product, partial [Allacma fusca]